VQLALLHLASTHKAVAFLHTDRAAEREIRKTIPKIHIGEKNSLFNKWCSEKWMSTPTRLKLDPYFSSRIKVNSK
jgi:hypothetical protein